MMDNPDEPEDGGTILEKDIFGLPSPSSSFGSSLGASHDFRRMFKPPNKKKYEEEMDKVIQEIKSKEAEMKSLGVRPNDVVTSDLEGIRAEKDANISKRKKVDAELKQLNLNIQKLRGSLSTTESNLHYKNEAKIDEAIRKLEWQLKVQNFKVAEERRIVAEIDKLKRSKKVLVQYFTQKRELDDTKARQGRLRGEREKRDLDDTKARQSRLRGERERYYKSVTTLKTREDDIRRTHHFNKSRGEELKKEIDELYNNKRKLFADFKQHESEYYRLQKEHKKAQRKESFKKREEDRRAKEMAYRKEMLEFEAQKEPFEDEKNLCNTLMSYLQRYVTTSGEETSLASPREEHSDPPISAGPGVADSLDDGMFVLLKKSDEGERDYSISNKRPNSKRGRKGRKQSVTKPLAHTPQIIAQFASLNLNAPSNMSEVGASVEQLQARKRYYDEHAATVPRPILGSISGSFSSSGSMSSMESPLRERSSTWGFVEVPPAIAENQTPSDCGRSAESGFHDMSRQASKTESSESAAECQPCDHALDELIRQSAEYGESEHSRSSSDTVTPEDHVTEEPDQSLGATGGHCVSSENSPVSADGSYETMNQSETHDSHKNWPISHDSDSAVFELGLTSEELLTGNNSCDSSLNTPNTYDLDFPETLNTKTMTMEKSPTFLDPIPQSFNHSVSNSVNANEVPRTDSHDIDCVQNNEKKLDENETLVDGCITDLTESSCKEDKSFHSGEPKVQETHKSATLNYSETESICEPQRQKSPNILLENDFINSNLEKIVFVKDNGSEIDTSFKCDKQDTCDKSPSADNIQHCDHDREGLGSNIGGFKSSIGGLEPSIEGLDASIEAELIAGVGLDGSIEAELIAGAGLDGSIEAGLKDIAGVGLDGSREATGIDIVECDQAGACMNENTRL